MAALLGAAAVMMACATTDDSNVGAYYQITENNTPFYRYGPQQAGGPDQLLNEGTWVVLARRGFGFSQIEIPDGPAGFIPSGSLSATGQAHPPMELQDTTDPDSEAGDFSINSPAVVRQFGPGEAVDLDLPEAEDDDQTEVPLDEGPQFRY